MRSLAFILANMMKPKAFFKCFYDAGYYTIMHDGIEHAGYLAFLGMLSLFPFLVLFVALTGIIGQAEIGTEFFNVVIANLPEHLTAALKPRIQEIIVGPPQGLLTVAIIGVLWTSSSAVEGTRTILNRAYRVATPPAYIWRRLMSILYIIILTALVILAMIILIIMPVLWQKIQNITGLEGMPQQSFKNLSYFLAALTLYVSVAASYYILPNIKQTFFSVAPGALIVVFLWMLSVEVLTAYLQNFNQVNLVYGSLGGVIAALLFFYVAAVIYIYGAEFNYFFEKALGHKIEQKEMVSPEVTDEGDKI